MNELWQLGALELAAKIRTREVSSVEVLEAHLARIDAVNGDVNAIVRRLDDEAREQAVAADRAVAAGDALGPLHGVPCTVKENIDLAGHPTTQGVPAMAEAIATLDAPVVERIRAAGAIPFARTNLPDFALRVHTDSSLHGLTHNPWDPSVTAGGSSGGEAAALATGMSPIGLGNDIGGSLRNPAHCCGVASIKPSTGVVPSASCLPPEDPLLATQLMAVQGPMARHVADVRAGLEAIAGAHVRDPISLPVVLADSSPDERLRIALVDDPPGGSTDPGIAGAIRSVADRLADAGHEIVEVTPPDYELTIGLWTGLLLADVRAQLDLLGVVMGEGGRALLDNFDRASPATDLAAVVGLPAERHRVMRAWSTFFADFPVVLSPTWAQRAFTHDADIDPETGAAMMIDTIRPVLPANILGLPAAITPAGVVDGLPVGVQVIGDRFSDLRCLSVAAEIESLVGPITPIDPITA